MTSLEIAVIADVHGNSRALEAVLADIRRRCLETIINLGDNANGPLEPACCVELLRGCGAVHVRGNGDRMTGEGGANVRGSAKFARERLDEEALRWLRELPPIASGDGWVAFHATPKNDEEYFLENVSAGKMVLATREEIGARLGGTDAALVLCGHTHQPRLVHLAPGRLLLNPGSVGLPAYEDSTPTPHVAQTGSPHARYAVVRRDDSGTHVEFVCLTYDWHAAAAAARAAGWPAWAQHLETGYGAPT